MPHRASPRSAPPSSTRVTSSVPGALLTGDPVQRLPGTVSFVFPGTSGEAVLLELERDGVICSSGSACAAGSDEPSHVLTAIGIPGRARADRGARSRSAPRRPRPRSRMPRHPSPGQCRRCAVSSPHERSHTDSRRRRRAGRRAAGRRRGRSRRGAPRGLAPDATPTDGPCARSVVRTARAFHTFRSFSESGNSACSGAG